MLNLLYDPTLTSVYDYWKNHSFDLVSKVMSGLFNILFSFVIALMAAVTILSDFAAPPQIIYHCFHISFIYLHEVMGPDAMILVF